MLPPPPDETEPPPALPPLPAGRKKGLTLPAGRRALSVDVSCSAVSGPPVSAQLSTAALAKAPLSTLLSAFGFHNGFGHAPPLASDGGQLL